MDHGGVPHQITSRLWAVRAIQSRSKEKLAKVIEVLDEISGCADGLSSELIRSLNLLKNAFLLKM
jgi:hypothetical protein